MILCSEKLALDEYCARVDREDEAKWINSSGEEDDEEESVDEDSIAAKKNFKLGDKRGLPASESTTRAKIQKTGEDRALRYLLNIIYRETGEGEIWRDESNGTINFENGRLVSFEGVVDLPIGNVPFSAWKICGVPCSSGNKWTDHSER
jgi:hypothetical protein